MNLKWIGAICIVVAASGFGMMLALYHKKEVKTLKNLITALDFMECELQFRMCALPELCRRTAAESDGVVQNVFLALSNELEDQISPDVRKCMYSAIGKVKDIPEQTGQCLELLGDSLGRFDLEGQLKSLENEISPSALVIPHNFILYVY